MLILWLQKERERERIRQRERAQGLPSNQGRLCRFSQVATPDMWGFGRKPDRSQWICQTQIHKQVAKSRRCAAFYFTQTGLKHLESENHFMVEQPFPALLLPFAVLLIAQCKYKLNWSIYILQKKKMEVLLQPRNESNIFSFVRLLWFSTISVRNFGCL